jgi:hypothetical protein
VFFARFSFAVELATWISGLAAAGALSAATVTLAPLADTRISEQSPDFNFGTDSELVIGTQGPSAGTTRNRGLLRFDLSGQVRPGSEITSVALTLTAAKVPLGGVDSVFEIRRVLREWGTSNVTWNSRLGTAATWSSAGAAAPDDFSSTLSATQAVSGLDRYTFGSTTHLIADVQAWIDQPATNFGWIMLTQSEGVAKTARRFVSSEGGTGAPALVIEYIPPPTIAEPGLQATNCTFHFNVEAGYDYAVEFTGAFPATNWLVLTNFSGKLAGFEASVTNSVFESPSRLFRLSRVPCNCR